jgi:tyrosinase
MRYIPPRERKVHQLIHLQQVLYGTMQTIVSEFPPGSDRDRYAAAASTFRIPYWDWAAAPPSGQSVLPGSLTTPTVTVNGPNGAKTIDNPLFAYKFHPNSSQLGYVSP